MTKTSAEIAIGINGVRQVREWTAKDGSVRHYINIDGADAQTKVWLSGDELIVKLSGRPQPGRLFDTLEALRKALGQELPR